MTFLELFKEFLKNEDFIKTINGVNRTEWMDFNESLDEKSILDNWENYPISKKYAYIWKCYIQGVSKEFSGNSDYKDYEDFKSQFEKYVGISMHHLIMMCIFVDETTAYNFLVELRINAMFQTKDKIKYVYYF